MNNAHFRTTWPNRLALVTAIPLFLLLGCAADNPSADQEYGQAVRHMLAIQTAYPDRNARGFDGQKASLSLQQYRKDVAKPQKVDTQELGMVTVGGSGG